MAFNIFKKRNKPNNEVFSETQMNEDFSPEAKNW